MALLDEVETKQDSRIFDAAGQSIFDLTTDAVMVTNASNTIIMVNEAFEKITGYSAIEVVGKDPSILSSGQHSKAFYNDLWKSLNTKGSWEGEIWNRRRDGQLYVEWARLAKLPGHPSSAGHIAVFADITKQRKEEEENFRRINFDSLTGLPNRRLFMDRLQQAVGRSARDSNYMAVLFIDLDGFKSVNDTLGHDAGDKLLASSAKRMSQCIRGSDTLARLGGDEFIILLSSIRTTLDAGVIAEKLINAVSRPYNLNGNRAAVSASIGISVYPDDEIDPAELIRKADVAMYQAKRNGKSHFQFFVPSLDASNEARAVANWDLRAALADNQFRVRFQPLVLAETGEVASAEALIAWEHPKLGRVSPEIFIPISEENGVIDEIGDLVLRESCRLIREMDKHGRVDFQVNVNVSPRQFRRAEAARHFEEIVRGCGVDPSSIVLELTENVFLTDHHRIGTIFQQLREAGFTLALDDFGTGYSSLSWLADFPFETMKIDKSFVQDSSASEEKRALIEAMIAIGERLHMTVVAEGVESSEQRRFVEGAGCGKFQGYLFSPAVELEAFLDLPQFMPLDGFSSNTTSENVYLTWTQQLSVGNAALDNDHQELIHIFNRFFNALSLDVDSADLVDLFDELVALAQRHFRREEAMMLAVGFDHAEEHSRVHRSLENTLLASRKRLLDAEQRFDRPRFQRFLTNWLMNHIMSEDREYIDAIQAAPVLANSAIIHGAA